jgi:hypothetical protein
MTLSDRGEALLRKPTPYLGGGGAHFDRINSPDRGRPFPRQARRVRFAGLSHSAILCAGRRIQRRHDANIYPAFGERAAVIEKRTGL